MDKTVDVPSLDCRPTSIHKNVALLKERERKEKKEREKKGQNLAGTVTNVQVNQVREFLQGEGTNG